MVVGRVELSREMRQDQGKMVKSQEEGQDIVATQGNHVSIDVGVARMLVYMDGDGVWGGGGGGNLED